MGCAAIAWPEATGIDPREILDAVGLPSETDRTARQLSGSANDLMRAAITIMNDLVLVVLEKRTAKDFVATRNAIFPQYLSALIAFGMLIKIAVPETVLERVIAESLSELEADFRDEGAAAFGQELRNRGLFTVWTLRKIVSLVETLPRDAVPTASEEAARNFMAAAIWARFHVECLVKSIRFKKTIFPDVVEPIADGLRAAVNAYALIRQVAPEQQTNLEFLPINWEAEDEAWLQDSIRDLERE